MLSMATRATRLDVCREGRFGLLAQTGSRAYGTNREDSDWDFKGVYVAHPHKVFSLGGAKQTIEPAHENFDITIYELAHFCKLAAAANPTVLEVLWAEDYDASTLGQMLRAHRSLFMSKKILNTYGGYAMSQVKKLRDGTGGARGQEHFKRRKFKLHTARLLMSGHHALVTGRLLVALDDTDLAEVNRAAELEDEAFERYIADGFQRLDRAAEWSSLRPEPYVPDIDRLMYSIRRLTL